MKIIDQNELRCLYGLHSTFSADMLETLNHLPGECGTYKNSELNNQPSSNEVLENPGKIHWIFCEGCKFFSLLTYSYRIVEQKSKTHLQLAQGTKPVFKMNKLIESIDYKLIQNNNRRQTERRKDFCQL